MIGLMVFLYVLGAAYAGGVVLAAMDRRKDLSVPVVVLSAVVGILFWPFFLGYISDD